MEGKKEQMEEKEERERERKEGWMAAGNPGKLVNPRLALNNNVNV